MICIKEKLLKPFFELFATSFVDVSLDFSQMIYVENIASNKVLIKSGLVYVNKFIDPINGKFDNWYELNQY